MNGYEKSFIEFQPNFDIGDRLISFVGLIFFDEAILELEDYFKLSKHCLVT
jgi:hypothetical protein